MRSTRRAQKKRFENYFLSKRFEFDNFCLSGPTIYKLEQNQSLLKLKNVKLNEMLHSLSFDSVKFDLIQNCKIWFFFFVSAGPNHLIETKRVCKDCTLSAGGGERGIGTRETWNSLEGLPSKYKPGPMLLKFCIWMGTSVSNMVNLLTVPFVL